jgi:hypothetical protein
MTERIIFCVETFFQQRDYARFGIEILLEQGFQVEIWEIFRPYRPEYAQTYSPPDPSSYASIKRFELAQDIYREIEHLGPADAVIAPWGWAHLRMAAGFFRALASSGAYIGSVVMGTGVEAVRRQHRTLNGIFDGLYRRAPNWLRRTRPWDFVFLSGGTVMESFTALTPGADHIWAHALDYDQVIESEAQGVRMRTAHIVFLDEYVPFHPDYAAHGLKAPNTAAEYYPKLQVLFSRLEQQLGLPVVIAAHPRSNYAEHQECFGGRRVVQGQTCTLVRDAILVLTHCSVSNNFTVAYRKPALVLTTRGLSESFYGQHIQHMAEMLGCPFIDLDEEVRQVIEIAPVDEGKYRDYFHRIIKREGTPTDLTWRIFSNHLKKRAT